MKYASGPRLNWDHFPAMGYVAWIYLLPVYQRLYLYAIPMEARDWKREWEAGGGSCVYFDGPQNAGGCACVDCGTKGSAALLINELCQSATPRATRKPHSFITQSYRTGARDRLRIRWAENVRRISRAARGQQESLSTRLSLGTREMDTFLL